MTVSVQDLNQRWHFIVGSK